MRKRLLTILMAVSLVLADTVPSLEVQAASWAAAGLSESAAAEEEAEDGTAEEEASAEAEETEAVTEEEAAEAEEETNADAEEEAAEEELLLEEEAEASAGLYADGGTVTEPINLYNSGEDAAGEGWSWEYETRTLTLTDFHMEIPNGTSAFAGIFLPDGSTVVSSGTSNQIICAADCAIYGDYLTFKGDAPFSLEGAYYGIWARYSLTIEGANLNIKSEDWAFCVDYAEASDIYFKGCAITSSPCILAKPTGGDVCGPMSAEGDYNNVLQEVTIASTEEPYLTWSQQPKSEYSIKSADEALSLTLSAQAVLQPGSETVSYQWYRCEDKMGTNAQAISGQTGSGYTLSGSIEEGIYYFFCRASAGTVTSDTSVVTVCASPSGKWYPNILYLGTSDISLGDYGIIYSFDAAANTGTLKLNNCTIGKDSVFAGISLDSSFKDGDLVVDLTGENRIFGCNGALWAVESGHTGNLIFTGDGSLDVRAGQTTIDARNMKVIIKDQAELSVENSGGKSPSKGLQAAQLQIRDGGKLALKLNSEAQSANIIYLNTYNASDFSVRVPEGGVIKKASSSYVLQDAEGGIVTEAVLESPAEATLVFADYPKSVSGAVGDTVSLTASAEMLNADIQPAITYTWYDESGNELMENDTGVYTADTAEPGLTYLYCVADCTYGEKSYTCTGDVIYTAVVPAGRILRTDRLRADTFTEDMKNEAEGWSWEQATKTLTLNGFMSVEEVWLPADSTLVPSEGTASSIYKRNNSNSPIRVSGNLTVKGKGSLKLYTHGTRGISSSVADATLNVQDVTLDITVKKIVGGTTSTMPVGGFSGVNLVKAFGSWKREGSTATLATYFNPQAVKLEKGTVSGTILMGTYDAETGFSEAVFSATDEDVLFLAKDLNALYGASVGTPLTLEVSALSTEDITYTWYNAADSATPIGTGSTLTLNPAVRGAESYYCVVKSGANELTSKTARVVTGAAGKTVRLGRLSIDSTTSTKDNLDTEGWKWEKETQTLTLSDFTSASNIYLGTDATIVLEPGTENMVFCDTGYYAIRMSEITASITGDAKLTCSTSLNMAEAALRVAGGARVEAPYAQIKSLMVLDEGSSLHLNRTEGGYALRLKEKPGEYDFQITAPDGAVVKSYNGYYCSCVSAASTAAVSDLTLQADSTERYDFLDYPKNLVSITAGNTVTLKAKAKLFNSSKTPVFTYTWYRKTENGEEVAAENTTGELSVTYMDEGSTTNYYCKAEYIEEGIPYTQIGDIVTVLMLLKNRTPRTSELNCSYLSTQKNEAEGWSWDKDTKTLTLDNFTCTRQITLPAGGTIVLKEGSQNLLVGTGESNQLVYGMGNITVSGKGSLSLRLPAAQSTGLWLPFGSLTLQDTTLDIQDEGCRSPLSLSGGIILDGADLTFRRRGNYTEALCTVNDYRRTGLLTGTMSGTSLYGTYYEETGYTEAVFSTAVPWMSFTGLSDRIQTAQVGDTVTLQAEAESNAADTITYWWYESDSGNENNAVLVGTGASITLDCRERGGKYYFCIASGGTLRARSDVVCVVTAAEGKSPVLKNKVCSGSSQDMLAEEGWKWDNESKTLTLSNAEMFIPFSSSSYNLTVYEGTTIVVLDDTVNNLGNYRGIDIGGSYAEEPAVTLKGKGTLNVGIMGAAVGSSNLNLKLQEGIAVNASQLHVNDITVRDGAELTAQSVTLQGDLVIEEGGLFRSNSSLSAENVTIEKGGMLFSRCGLRVNGTDGTSTLMVNGTLDISVPGSKELLSVYHTADTEPVILGENVAVVTPQGAVLKESSDNNAYSYYLNDAPVQDRLLIAEKSLASKAVTKIGAVKGKASYGQILTAGAVTPAGATVSYQWQYADAKEGPWKNISGATEKTWEVLSPYAGKYLRVTASGYGAYRGEAVSAAVGPAEGNPTALAGIYLVNARGEVYHIGSKLFSGNQLVYTSSYQTAYEDDTLTLVALPASDKAEIIIENVTNGFTAEGRSAEVPLAFGQNELRIHVSYNGWTNVYTVNQKRKALSDVSLNLRYLASETGAMTATWRDEEGILQKAVADNENPFKTVQIPQGTEVTLTVETLEGLRAFRYITDNNSELFGAKADWTKEDSPYTFVVKNKTSLTIDNTCLEYLAPETEADWLASEENTIHVRTEAQVMTYSDKPGERRYYDPQIELWADGDSPVCASKNVFTGVDADSDGYYDYWEADIPALDSTKDYTVKAGCVRDKNSGSPEDMFYSIFKVEARKSVQLIPEKDYVVLKPGQTTTVGFAFDGYDGSELEMDANASTDTEVVNPADCILTQKTKSDAAGIRIQAGTKEGTTYLTVKAVDTVDPLTGKVSYAVARIRVDVSSAETTETVSLGITSGSLNVYDDSGITVPVYRMNCGYPIAGAEFADAAVRNKFQIQVLNDRTISVTPVVPADSDTMDWAAWAKSMKGTVSSRVTIHYSGAASRTSEEALTIKADAKVPAVKAAAVKANSFYQNGTTTISYTFKGGTVAYAKVDAVKNTAKTKACPDWLTLSEDGKSVVLQSSKLTNNKASGKLYLKVWPEGWRAPAQITVSVSAAYTVPKLKLSEGTISVADTKDKFSRCTLSVQSADKKVSLESLNITEIRVATEADLALLSAKERTAYAASGAYRLSGFVAKTGTIYLTYNNTDPVSGKVLLIVTLGGDKTQTVKLPLTVKTVAAPTLKLDKSSITLNTTLGTGYQKDIQEVALIPGAVGYPISDSNTTVTMTDAKGNGDYSSALDISQSNNGTTLSLSCTNQTTPGMTYKVTVAVEGMAKPAAFTVKTQVNAPTIKLSRTRLTLNRAKGSGCDKQVTIATPSIKDYPLFLGYLDLSIFDAAGNDATANFVRQVSYSGNQNIITVQSTNNTAAGTYKMQISDTLPDGSMTKTAVCTIKVVDTIPKVKLSASAITLNRDLMNYDKAVVELKGLDGYDNRGTSVQIRDSRGNVVSNAITCVRDENVLTFQAKENAQPGATYKAQISRTLAYGLRTKPVTLTIKVAPQKDGSTPVTVKGSAKGTIDLTRPDTTQSSISLTATGWHALDYSTEGANAPKLTWKVYAKNGKVPVTKAEGALNNSGLVAEESITGTGTSRTSGSWFFNQADGSENPYAIALGVDTAGAAWADGKVSPAYTYTCELTLTFPTTGVSVTSKPVAIKVTQGKTRFSQSAKTIALSRRDPYGRQLLHIESSDKNPWDVSQIETVEIVNSTTASALELYEVTNAYGSGKTYAIGWKDRVVPVATKNGSVKLNIYLEGNDPARKKPNAVITLSVTFRE